MRVAPGSDDLQFLCAPADLSTVRTGLVQKGVELGYVGMDYMYLPTTFAIATGTVTADQQPESVAA